MSTGGTTLLVANKPLKDSEVGISFFRASVPDSPLVIEMVRTDGLFATSGLKPGMIVVSVMEVPSRMFSTADEATEALRSAIAGEIVIEVVRMGDEDTITKGLESSTSISTTANMHVEKDRQLLQAYTRTTCETSSTTANMQVQRDFEQRQRQAQRDRAQLQRERQARRDREELQIVRQAQKDCKQRQKRVDTGCYVCDCIMGCCCFITN